jgi:hypothetical protein
MFMQRLFFLFVIFSFSANAQKYAARDLQKIKLYCTGSFVSELHATTDSLTARLRIRPIWNKRKDGVWLFAEKKGSVDQYQVWHFYIEDDSTLLLQCLSFKEENQAVQLGKDFTLQSKLKFYNLLNRHGCELYLKKNKLGYNGYSVGKDCYPEKNGVEYAQYAIDINKSGILLKEAGYSKDDKLLYGNEGAGIMFLKK